MSRRGKLSSQEESKKIGDCSCNIALTLDRHRSHFFFHFNGIDHHDGVPRTTIEEAAVRPFAEALLAPDAKDGVNLDAAKRWMILVRHPKHAIFHRAILDARGRTRAPSAALCDDRKLFRLLLTWRGEALGPGFRLEFVGNHPDSFGGTGYGRHAAIIAWFGRIVDSRLRTPAVSCGRLSLLVVE